ncbi:sensor histidine kinase [Antrihabitans cavernicola]|uniref:ATP-binding protein n=1 Tax=Antrihabitans cavernicola TaxID=2495913 RepID=A0A5A7S2U2_9NOCA|nr:ATP-binding protein [Spelaeibacter cavernicola]KAA0018481.1 ATP-binding protein [Spelaeibacter cavernicola]
MATTAGAAAALTSIPSAHDRLTRSAAAFAGVGGLFYGVVLMPDILGQTILSPAWWTPCAVIAVFGSALAIVIAAARGSIRAIHCSISTFAIVYLVAIATWFVSYDGAATLSNEKGLWLSMFPGLAALAVSITWRPTAVFGYLALACVMCQLQGFNARIDHGNNPVFFEIAFGFTFSALFTAACMGVVRAGRILDETALSARTNAAQSAATEARGAERRRFDALIHDGAMATFLSASRADNTAELAAQATATLRQLDRLRSGASSADTFDAAGLVTHIRTSAAAIDDNAPIVVALQPNSSELQVPPEVARALGAGVIEAIRNIERHAGAASYEVRVDVDGSSARIDVVDDGVGFDPTAVPPHRLGLQVSIRGRFDELDNGWSRVESARGVGTRISMGWRRV